MPRPLKPETPTAVAFFDGQNLFRSAREAFGTDPTGSVDYRYPNYDPLKLAQRVCNEQGWQLEQVRFYTGVPPSPDWRHGWWSRKQGALGKHPNVFTFQRETRNNREKGIDVRIALDILRLTIDRALDIALVFSQDQDLAEVREDLIHLARRQRRWIRLASAFPYSAQAPNQRGINGSHWIRIDRALYESCLDPHDYRRR